jgi:uncharacterized protein (DUF362 family)
MAQVVIKKADYNNPEIDTLLEPLGGMENFVKQGDRVLLKVNLLSAREPEKAVTTHPAFVRAVAKAVRKAGGEPFIGDSPAGLFSKKALKKAYKLSGLEDMAREEIIPLNYDTGSEKRDIPGGKKLRKSPFCNFIFDADKTIALPKLKTHSFQYLTLACKVMYGAVPGLTKVKYHAQFPRNMAFADMLLDILSIAKPQLYIMDGILGMEGQGPATGGDPIELGLALASTDPVAMDIAVCRAFGIEPVGIPVMKRAKIRGLWPEKIDYPLLQPEGVLYKGFKLPSTAEHLITGKKTPKKSPMITDKCIACGDCEEICPKGAAKVDGAMARIDYLKCIRCYCCHEVCPENAIKLGIKKSYE